MIRLCRKPSLWANFYERLFFAVIFAGGLFFLTWYASRHMGIRTYMYAILGFFDLIAAAVIADLFIRLWRTRGASEPVVEIVTQPLAYGDSSQMHIVEGHSESVAEVGIKLIGECQQTSVTDFTEFRETKVAQTRCYQEELLRLKTPVDHTLQVQLPKVPPAEGIRWKILVETHLKQGGVVEHLYPLSVRE